MEEYKYYIAGEFKTGDEKINVVNPATEEIFARLSQTSEKDLQAAEKDVQAIVKILVQEVKSIGNMGSSTGQ